jgi:DNA-binding GntR family transcriptional regulator
VLHSIFDFVNSLLLGFGGLLGIDTITKRTISTTDTKKYFYYIIILTSPPLLIILIIISCLIINFSNTADPMPTYLYQQVYDNLKQRIERGQYKPDSPLPSESRLKREFNVSQITIRRALKELVHEGLLVSRQGRGHFVQPPSENGAYVIGLSSFTSDVLSGKLDIVRTLLVDEMIPAETHIAEKLRVQNSSLLRYLKRLDISHGKPFSVDEVYMQPSYANGINSEIAASPLFMHDIQRVQRLSFSYTSYDIQVEPATEDDAELLETEPDAPLLTTGELVFDTSSNPVMWVVSRYPAYSCKLSGMVTLVQSETEYGTIGE